MYLNSRVAFIGLTVASCVFLAGCTKKMPECGDQNIQDTIGKMNMKRLEQQAAIVGEKYSTKPQLRNVFYQATPKITYKQDLTGFASQKQDKEVGKNYCSATNRSEVATIDLVFKVDPHYGGDEKALLADTLGALHEQGENARVDDDSIIVSTTFHVPGSVDYTAQFSDNGDELIVKIGKE